MNDVFVALLGLVPILLALFLCFKAGIRRAQNGKWLRLVLLSFFFLLLGWLMCYATGILQGYETAQKYYEELLRGKIKPPKPAPPPLDKHIQTA